jgi:hypothetical protein
MLLDDLEKYAVRNYTLVGNVLLTITSYFVINSELHFHFWPFFLIFFSVMCVSSTLQVKIYNHLSKLKGNPIGKYMITFIFCMFVFPLTVGITFIVGTITNFHSGYLLFTSLPLFFGALNAQAAIDTVIKVSREEISKEKVTFKVKSNS